MATCGDTATQTCPQCQRRFDIVRKVGRPVRFCSPECRAKACSKAKWARGYRSPSSMPKKLLPATPCKQCGLPTTRPQYCSSMCCQITVGSRTGFQPQMRSCAECEKSFEARHSRTRFCTAECRLQANNRKSTGIRRARQAGLDRERFDPVEIFERDGWRCHLCGRKTDKRLRGTYAKRAPQLDHIVPISKGGPHTRLNVACSCHECNNRKGSKIVGQLILIAA